MKKSLISMAVLAVLSSSQVIAEGDNIAGGARYNFKEGELIIPCVKFNDPGGESDGKFFDVKLQETDTQFNFTVIGGSEESNGVCEALIDASLEADEDTTDTEGDSDGEDMEGGDTGGGDTGGGDSGNGGSGGGNVGDLL
jgi:hypothetical protein